MTAETMTDQQMADALAAKGWLVRPAPTRPQMMEQMATVAAHHARCMAEKIDALIPYVDDDTDASDWARAKVTEIFLARLALDRLEAALRARDARKQGRKAA
tara:strand:+ start:15448 stop:15753 length:306 start_codon:yes stop_codon:yes gene_type:complete